jgi:hypothetical protein
VVEGLGDRQPARLGEDRDHLLRESGRGVDAGAHGGAPERHFGDAGEGRLHALDAEAHLAGVPAEFLAEGDGRGIHQVGASGLDGRLPQLGLLLERHGKVLHRRDEGVEQVTGHRDVHRRREDVIRGLRHVDVVVRVHGGAERGGCQARQHLVDVHVRRRA